MAINVEVSYHHKYLGKKINSHQSHHSPPERQKFGKSFGHLQQFRSLLKFLLVCINIHEIFERKSATKNCVQDTKGESSLLMQQTRKVRA